MIPRALPKLMADAAPTPYTQCTTLIRSKESHV